MVVYNDDGSLSFTNHRGDSFTLRGEVVSYIQGDGKINKDLRFSDKEKANSYFLEEYGLWNGYSS